MGSSRTRSDPCRRAGCGITRVPHRSERRARGNRRGNAVQFDFEAMSAMQRFEFLTGTVVPRPIALITTLSADGKLNAAPYSFFGIMGIDPPVMAFTVLPTADGRMKDTGENVLATGECVVNLVSETMAEAMNVTCIDAPPGVDEVAI